MTTNRPQPPADMAVAQAEPPSLGRRTAPLWAVLVAAGIIAAGRIVAGVLSAEHHPAQVPPSPSPSPTTLCQLSSDWPGC